VSAGDAQRTVRIATRGSRLALWQAEHVAGLLRSAAPETPVELVLVSTAGDRDRLSPLTQFGGEGAFTKEVQAAVLDLRADLAVHSLKDLPTEPTPGLVLAGTPERGPTGDALLLPGGRTISSLDDLPDGTRCGTGSLRRRAQLWHVRPELEMSDVRGNVETRLRKLDEGKEYDALILAEAGLARLGLADRIGLRLGPPVVYAAVGQAALGLECRADDAFVQEIVTAIIDPSAFAAVQAERSCLHTLRAGCHAPVGVQTWFGDDGNPLWLEGVVLSADGRDRVVARSEAPAADAVKLGAAVARELIGSGAAALLGRAG
jgi:hydroxymethylbilane synthase